MPIVYEIPFCNVRPDRLSLRVRPRRGQIVATPLAPIATVPSAFEHPGHIANRRRLGPSNIRDCLSDRIAI